MPFLREKGFKGSLTHFRQQQTDGINLLTFQHSLCDNKFVVETANCPSNGIMTHWGKEIPKNRFTGNDQAKRLRLGSEKNDTDNWFEYDKKQLFTDIYQKRAKEIIDLQDEAENWWTKDPFEQ
ncbi:DUF4304 domain-containing protein [Jiulongibacter sediminis]|uniref:DUF4304 domain-containing protein n=1 Tax=Jiulongibacter sediminis TaxID=1605367 RepID=UPI0006DCA132|nr:DUF4304 domain-containing protein [Jiulongibacter sediminis]